MGAVVLIGAFIVVALLAKKLGLLLLLIALVGTVLFLTATQAWGVLTLLVIVAVLFAIVTLYVQTHK